jgi:two-component system OmpR family sensor kinase
MTLSLRARFALAAGLLVLLVATAVAVAGYVSLDRSLIGRARRAAADQAVQLGRLIDTGRVEETGGQQGNYVELTDRSLTGQLVRPGLWVVIGSSSGAELHRSPGAPAGLLAPGVLQRCRRNGSASAARSPPGAVLGCRRIGSARAPVGFVVAAMPLADTRHTLAGARRALVAGVLVGSLLSFLLAWLVAERALRPVRLIAQTARSIRHGDLGRRIAYAGPRDELGELAAELDASFAELEGALRRQERFVADASHELKTPLTAARANVQLLRRWAADDPAARAGALAALERSTAKMARIVADLVQLAEGDGHLRYERAPVQLDDLVIGAQLEARSLAAGVDVVVTHLDQTVVIGDRVRLEQLLANLVDNALRATPAGASVRIALVRDGEQVRLSVADDGPGIAADERPLIFERFYRGDPAPSDAGSGLGLAIARSIARAHDGDIEVASEPGHGSVFTVVLPLRESSSDRHRDLTGSSSPGPTVERHTTILEGR